MRWDLKSPLLNHLVTNYIFPFVCIVGTPEPLNLLNTFAPNNISASAKPQAQMKLESLGWRLQMVARRNDMSLIETIRKWKMANYLKGNDPIGGTHFWLPWLWEKVYGDPVASRFVVVYCQSLVFFLSEFELAKFCFWTTSSDATEERRSASSYTRPTVFRLALGHWTLWWWWWWWWWYPRSHLEMLSWSWHGICELRQDIDKAVDFGATWSWVSCIFRQMGSTWGAKKQRQHFQYTLENWHGTQNGKFGRWFGSGAPQSEVSCGAPRRPLDELSHRNEGYLITTCGSTFSDQIESLWTIQLTSGRCWMSPTRKHIFLMYLLCWKDPQQLEMPGKKQCSARRSSRNLPERQIRKCDERTRWQIDMEDFPHIVYSFNWPGFSPI